MIASSSTALGNLAYLIGAVVLAVAGGLAVSLRHRKPKSIDANVASFRRGLSALAPDDRPRYAKPAPRSDDLAARSNSVPGGLTHVRLERGGETGAGEGAAEESRYWFPTDVDVRADADDPGRQVDGPGIG